jgi:hypothetical protein
MPRTAGSLITFAAALAIAAPSQWVLADEDDHAGLTWEGPGTCLECHTDEAADVHGSVMYQWQGGSPQMTTGPASQGKIAGGVNSYCINILGNWNACGGCHIGLGAMPQTEATPAELANIDCLLCHQQAYKRKRVDGVFVPDTEAMAITMDQAVQTVHEPVRANCLQCHGAEEDKDFEEIHEKHVKDKDFDCSWCHGFSRPERALAPSPLLFFDDFESASTNAWSP